MAKKASKYVRALIDNKNIQLEIILFFKFKKTLQKSYYPNPITGLLNVVSVHKSPIYDLK